MVNLHNLPLPQPWAWYFSYFGNGRNAGVHLFPVSWDNELEIIARRRWWTIVDWRNNLLRWRQRLRPLPPWRTAYTSRWTVPLCGKQSRSTATRHSIAYSHSPVCEDCDRIARERSIPTYFTAESAESLMPPELAAQADAYVEAHWNDVGDA